MYPLSLDIIINKGVKFPYYFHYRQILQQIIKPIPFRWDFYITAIVKI